ncbi:metal-sulfur cluster assembly factor [Hydrogenothermus marinus]|uniref:Metal-sulfur cluster biosynthetic enzyme n=1 Tax=Hydrogenothermus marinus TaxID=133270 RepID=A0A3M0BAI8_9AQUI|nr:metal-sulfur cluster assembly factor [Hydrogenothermus marinus]RMA93189.1 metal-sulfur cluster biosynthetic enzyme [Hydrogenothermus marinus]
MDKENIYNILSNICDPEIPLDIVNLGLVKDIKIKNNEILIKMTLTTPKCPLEDLIRKLVENAIKKEYPEAKVKIDFIFDKPWNTEEISEEGKEKLRKLGWNL